MQRDSSRGRVYAAETQVRSAIERAASAEWLDFFGSRLPTPSERSFSGLEEVRTYVRQVLAEPVVQAAIGILPVPRVRERAGQSEAHYEYDGQVIALPVTGDWALRELVVLHELSHHVVALRHPKAIAHGQEFAGVFCLLVSHTMGHSAALILQAALDGEGITVPRYA